ncbi:hypothetical protein ACDQ55_20500 [Chitinophaga sp. 30R24]|uniref:hypothetical protein n=1 Tax=Chitinophaga sp. 30R24 TaxID=3248838 RepID=UPI003B8F5F8A
MKMVVSLLLLTTLSLSLVSCSKLLEMSAPDPGAIRPGIPSPVSDSSAGGGNAHSMEGVWTFVGVVVNSSTSSEQIGMKLVSSSVYTTTNNGGVFTIDSKNISFKALTYTMNGISRMSLYNSNGSLFQESILPIAGAMPPYDGAATYHKLTADSIAMENSFVQLPDNSGISTQAMPAKALWNGDTLILKIYISAGRSSDNTLITGTEVLKLVPKK